MSKKPESAAGSARNLAELEIEGVGKLPVERVATIGRAPDSDVVLNIRSVSRHHARIFYEGGHFWIKDLESGNGTTVNGKRVTLQMLSDNDRVCFGEAVAVFRTGTESAGPAPIARDPLEGSEGSPQDGTPTGGLKGPYTNIASSRPINTEGDATVEDVAANGGVVQDRASALKSEVERLQRDNISLRNEISQLRSADLAKENERLRRLVSQLEHALSDANIRLRNVQDRLNKS